MITELINEIIKRFEEQRCCYFPCNLHAFDVDTRTNYLIFVLQIPGIVVAHSYDNLVCLGIRVCDLQV